MLEVETLEKLDSRKISDKLIFENTDSDILTTVIENKDIPKVLDNLMTYVDVHINRLDEEDEPVLSEMILDFCNEYYYSVDAIADVINSDDEFKDLLYNNCLKYNILREIEESKI